MEIQGYALFAAVIVLVAVVYPALSWRTRVALATPIAESESENLRVVNSVDRWSSSRSVNHGTILPRVESRMSAKRRVDPTNLRTLAASRARARARVSQRTARMKALGMGLGAAVLVSLIAWIAVAATSLTIVLGIVPTVLTAIGAGLYGKMLIDARELNHQDQIQIAKLDAKLEKLSATARAQDRKGKPASSKRAPRRVQEARRASAASAASAESMASAQTGLSANDSVSAPSVASAPETVQAAPVQEKPKPAPKRESVMPSYTPKPTFARRTVKPFEPEEAPVAAVPYRPTQLGEKFTSATSAQSADAAPVIASFNFDDVIEARRHA
ncbi:hypothetical protein [Flaviflexus sp.]|uniref:hypothetical protein n=1 Tax=Flaviflexus sp. TaxID=1969482 RepID=UPI003F9379C5